MLCLIIISLHLLLYFRLFDLLSVNELVVISLNNDGANLI